MQPKHIMMRRAVWVLRALQSQQDTGSWRGKENKDKRMPVCLPDFSLLSRFAVLKLVLVFWWLCADVLIPPFFSVFKWGRRLETERRRDTTICKHTHTHTRAHRSAVLLAPLLSLHANPRLHWRQSAIHILWALHLLQCSCLIAQLLGGGESYGFVSVAASLSDLFPRLRHGLLFCVGTLSANQK